MYQINDKVSVNIDQIVSVHILSDKKIIINMSNGEKHEKTFDTKESRDNFMDRV